MNGIKRVSSLYDLRLFFLLRRLPIGCGLCLAILLFACAASADDEQSTNDDSKAEADVVAEKASDTPAKTQVDAKALIKQAYEISRQVTSIEDLERIVSILDEFDHETVSEKDASYVRSLQAWALHAHGKRLVDDTDRLRRIGEVEEAEQILEKALEMFGRAIEKDNRRASSFQQRGVILAGQGKLVEAIDDFDSAIELKPDDAASWFNRAEVFYAKQEYELASGDYQQVLELNSDDVQALTGRAHCSLQTGQLEEAIADYKRVTQIQQGDTNALTNLADAQQAAGQWEAADKSYRSALEASTSNARAYRGIAWMYATCPDEKLQKPQIALQAAKKSIKLTGRETAENMDTLAAAYAANENFELAQRSQKRAVALAKDEAKALIQDRLETYSANQVYRQGEIERR